MSISCNNKCSRDKIQDKIQEIVSKNLYANRYILSNEQIAAIKKIIKEITKRLLSIHSVNEINEISKSIYEFCNYKIKMSKLYKDESLGKICIKKMNDLIDFLLQNCDHIKLLFLIEDIKYDIIDIGNNKIEENKIYDMVDNIIHISYLGFILNLTKNDIYILKDIITHITSNIVKLNNDIDNLNKSGKISKLEKKINNCINDTNKYISHEICNMEANIEIQHILNNLISKMVDEIILKNNFLFILNLFAIINKKLKDAYRNKIRDHITNQISINRINNIHPVDRVLFKSSIDFVLLDIVLLELKDHNKLNLLEYEINVLCNLITKIMFDILDIKHPELGNRKYIQNFNFNYNDFSKLEEPIENYMHNYIIDTVNANIKAEQRYIFINILMNLINNIKNI